MNTGDHMTPAVCRHHWLLSLRVGSLNCRSKLSEVNPQLLKDFQTIPIFFGWENNHKSETFLQLIVSRCWASYVLKKRLLRWWLDWFILAFTETQCRKYWKHSIDLLTGAVSRIRLQVDFQWNETNKSTKNSSVGSMGRTLYLPTLILWKSTIHVGRYTVRPMDPSWNMWRVI